jgi:NAD(P)-dependent dehydrogenase (short-subunit alcohol dehydrogenase family)
MAGRLQNKVVCITGAAQGIGAGIAESMAQEGARIIIGDVNDDGAGALAARIGATALHLDVSSPEDWQAMADHVAKHFGKLDILVNNAGLELVKPMQDHSLADWRKVMSVNVDGIFLGCKTLEAMLRVPGTSGSSASVINISSIAGIVGYPDQLAYNTSKGAVRHMSKSLAIEWAAHGDAIRCNSIHPGCIRTPMLEMAVEGWIENGSVPADDPWTAIAALCPLNRVGMPKDIAMGAVYLGSDESRFVTGIELVIDGGWVAR